jgi:hypothetical protein
MTFNPPEPAAGEDADARTSMLMKRRSPAKVLPDDQMDWEAPIALGFILRTFLENSLEAYEAQGSFYRNLMCNKSLQS